MVQWWAEHAGLGIPVAYEGSGILPEKEFYNVVMQWDMQCRYENGLVMRFMDNRTAAGAPKFPGIPGPNAATFVGSEGWISVGYSEIQAQPAAVLDSVIGPEEIPAAYGILAGGHPRERCGP